MAPRCQSFLNRHECRLADEFLEVLISVLSQNNRIGVRPRFRGLLNTDQPLVTVFFSVLALVLVAF